MFVAVQGGGGEGGKGAHGHVARGMGSVALTLGAWAHGAVSNQVAYAHQYSNKAFPFMCRHVSLVDDGNVQLKPRMHPDPPLPSWSLLLTHGPLKPLLNGRALPRLWAPMMVTVSEVLKPNLQRGTPVPVHRYTVQLVLHTTAGSRTVGPTATSPKE